MIILTGVRGYLIIVFICTSEKTMASHSSTLAWKIPWMEEPGGLYSMGSLRVGRNWATHFHFHAMEKEMATHSSVLAWRIPGMGEPGGLPSMESHRVGHDWCDLAAAAAMVSNVEHFSCVGWPYACPLWKFLFKSSPHVLIGLYVFWNWAAWADR